MSWIAIFAWAAALFTVACAMVTWWTLHRTHRNVERIKLLWAEQAPPVPPVEVTLKSGETLDVRPMEPHQAWVWFLDVPVAPDEVDYITLPDLPPWTSIVPIPPGGFR